MFGFFHFSSISGFAAGAFQMVDGMVTSLLNNMNVQEYYEPEYENEEYDYGDEPEEEEQNDIIELETFNNMYILSIKTNGVNLKELSIKYEGDIIDVNLNRIEYGQNYYANNIIRRHYNKTFDNIEAIDTERLFKTMDNGILSITMPKKYAIEEGNIVEADFIEVKDNVNKLN